MNHPLTTCISEIEFLQERIREKNTHIEKLEAAQLKFIIWLENQKPSAVQTGLSPEYNKAVLNTLTWMIKEARTALAPEQDK